MNLWTFHSTEYETYPVIPDGCRDFILIQNSESNHFHISEIMEVPKIVNITPNHTYTGIRLPPGTLIVEEFIHREKPVTSSQELITLVEEFTVEDSKVTEALQTLSIFPSPQLAAKDLGVQLRTLQRFVKKKTGKSPYFWTQLARIRKASRLLLIGEKSCDVAYECSFSDQAHLTREIKRWFLTTPQTLKRLKKESNSWTQQFFEAGYDSPL